MRSRALIMSGGEQYGLKENQYTLDLNFEELVKVCRFFRVTRPRREHMNASRQKDCGWEMSLSVAARDLGSFWIGLFLSLNWPQHRPHTVRLNHLTNGPDNLVMVAVFRGFRNRATRKSRGNYG